MSRPTKIGLVCSSGGHLTQLLRTQPAWEQHDHFWVTFDTQDAINALAGKRRYWCHHPTNRHIPNLIRNTLLAARILLRERPTLLISTGAAVAVPFFYIGKLLNVRTVFIEAFDRVYGPTITGRIIRPVTDQYLVQWPEQLSFYPRSRLIGPLL